MVESLVHAFDVFFGWLTPAQWDSWRNWIVAVGGLIALAIATNTYRRNVKTKREEQARLVYSRLTAILHPLPGEYFRQELISGIESGVLVTRSRDLRSANPDAMAQSVNVPSIHATVKVHNGSKELIGPVRVQMVELNTRKTLDNFSMLIDAIEPETDFPMTFTWPNDIHPAQAGYGPTLLFRDASGKWWRRLLAEPIERVHNDPNNLAQSAAERIFIRNYQQSIGVAPSHQIKDPKVPPIAHWHRFWRKIKGKSPTP